MLTTQLYNAKTWLKTHPNPRYRNLFASLKRIRSTELRTPWLFNKIMYMIHKITSTLWEIPSRLFFYTPAFKGRLSQCGRRLYLYGGVPFVSGPLAIHLGNDCRISGQTTFSGRSDAQNPLLIVGNNVDISWQTTIAVGNKVIIQDNVRIAGGGFLFGYSGHPIDAKRRADGEGDDANQVGDIVLEQDVWLGTNVTVRQGVTIGQGTIVAAGSVVVNDLPAFVIAAGNPARIVSNIDSDSNNERLKASNNAGNNPVNNAGNNNNSKTENSVASDKEVQDA